MLPQKPSFLLSLGALAGLSLGGCLGDDKPVPVPDDVELRFDTVTFEFVHGPGIELAWTLVPEAPHGTTYEVQRQADQTEVYFNFHRTAATAFTDYRVDWNRTYRYRVLARNEGGDLLAESVPVTAVVSDYNRLTVFFGETPPPVTNSANAQFTFSTNKPAQTRCAVDQHDWRNCEGVWAEFDLAEGKHRFYVEATYNESETATHSYEWRIDRTPPTIWIVDAPASTIYAETASFSFWANETCRFICRVDTSAWTDCHSPLHLQVAAGDHTLELACTDLAGNTTTTPVTYHWHTQLPTWTSVFPQAGNLLVAAHAELAQSTLLLSDGDVIRRIDSDLGTSLWTAPVSEPVVGIAAEPASNVASLRTIVASASAIELLDDDALLWQWPIPTSEIALGPIWLEATEPGTSMALIPTRPVAPTTPTDTSHLYALALTNGAVVWLRTVNGGFSQPLAATQISGTWLAIAAANDGYVYGIAASNGTEVWQRWLPSIATSPPIVVPKSVEEFTVWIPTANGRLYGLSASNGTTVADVATADGWPAISGLAAAKFASGVTDLVYATAGGRIVRASTQDGSTVCQSALVGAISAGPIV